MRSCKNQCLIRFFLCWVSLRNWCQWASRSVADFYYYLKDYYYGHHDTWLFVSGHSVPIALNHFYNTNHVSWVYHNTTVTLEKSIDDTNKDTYKLGWLSAKILIRCEDALQEEYDIDDFLGALRIQTTREYVPTLSNLFSAWCAYKKHWFQTHCDVEFYIIDEMGQDRILELVEHNFCLVIHRDKIVAA